MVLGIWKSWGRAAAAAEEFLSWFLLCGAKCFHPPSAVEGFWEFEPPPPLLLLLWRKGKSLLCFHISAFLGVMGISQREMQWGIGMGMRTKQKNSSRQSLVLSKHHSLSKTLCCPGPCVLTLQHAPELHGIEVSEYAKEPVFGIGLLSHWVVPAAARGVPKCPLNKICTFKEIVQKYGLWSSATPHGGQHLSPQWLHLSGAEGFEQTFIGGAERSTGVD